MGERDVPGLFVRADGRPSLVVLPAQALAIYPESRPCKRPTTEQILKIFESLMVHRLSSAGGPQHIYQPNLTRLQRRALRLLGIQSQACWIGME